MEQYYSLLNISAAACLNDIKKAYKKLAKQHHPDNGGDAEMFTKIRKAYEEILDKKQDQSEDDSYRRNNRANINIFNKTQKEKSPSISVKLDIDPINLLRKTTKAYKFQIKKFCVKCDGNKYDTEKLLSSHLNHYCEKCFGKGYSIKSIPVHHTTIETNEICDGCNGDKVIISEKIKCDTCKGQGCRLINKNIEITFFPGINSTITLRNSGNHIKKSHEPGDIVIYLFFKSDICRVASNDILYFCNISLHDAYINRDKKRSIYLDLLDSRIKINIPNNIQIQPNDVIEIEEGKLKKSGKAFVLFNVLYDDKSNYIDSQSDIAEITVSKILGNIRSETYINKILKRFF